MKLVALALVAWLAACGSDGPKDPIAELEKPSTCMSCHPTHYQQWSGSMHAYASMDPVFLAMNKRGQRETGGALGTFCVQCHAPMAVALGDVTAANAADFDPTTLPEAEQGVTCYFCHDVDSVKADHNNGVVLALDDTMRGGVSGGPALVDTPAHHTKTDPMMASSTNKSAICGSCHDVVTPAGVAIERTYAEWQASVFPMDDPEKLLPLTCSGCHMVSSPNEPIADAPSLNVPSRANGIHDHSMAAIDTALTTFPDTANQLVELQSILDPALQIASPIPSGSRSAPGGICLQPPTTVSVRMQTGGDGHMYPSGAAQDRRSWLELVAYDASNTVLFSSGLVGDDQDPEDINDPMVNCTGGGSSSCTGFWDRIYKGDGSPAHFFWEVATEGSHLLKPQVTFDMTVAGFDHSTTALFDVGSAYSSIDHMTARIRTRAFNYAALDDLVTSGDLDPAIASQMLTLESAGATRTWTRAQAGMGIAVGTFCDPQ